MPGCKQQFFEIQTFVNESDHWLNQVSKLKKVNAKICNDETNAGYLPKFFTTNSSSTTNSVTYEI